MRQNVNKFIIVEKTLFSQMLEDFNETIERKELKILQINVGWVCNQVCKHCHVDAGPRRLEVMKKNTMDRLLEVLHNSPQVETVDITGGAPELNPYFRYFVSCLSQMGKIVIDRCNLTVLLEPDQEDTAEFLRDHKVNIVASLPCYTQQNVDNQRGKDVFTKSIKALKILNDLGYGKKGTELIIDLVYNPGGAFLPGDQSKLEADYKVRLKEEHGIEFNSLFTMINMPINRFERTLKQNNVLDEYKNLLVNNFNADAAKAIMCRELVSIGWNGLIYDCDFNQMLDISVYPQKTTIWDIDSLSELDRQIAFKDHCFGCTAGAGSSCSGTLN